MLLTHFVKDRRLTKPELERIRQIIDERLEVAAARSGPNRRAKP
jgi:hypothetical protein